MKEISAHELSEQRQRQMVEQAGEKELSWSKIGHELVFDKNAVREALKESHEQKTVVVKSILP